MADRRSQPQQLTSFAAIAAFFLMSAVIAAPAIAASAKQIPCPDETLVANLDVPVDDLVTEFVNNDLPDPATSVLAPLAAAAIREAFKERDSEIGLSATEIANDAAIPPMAGTESIPAGLPRDSDSSNSAEFAPDMTTRLPGVSDEALTRYKKLMYRRDI